MNETQGNQNKTEALHKVHAVLRVTKTSKYLAALLFILLPFVGGWIGYMLAPLNPGTVHPTDSVITLAQPTLSPTIETAVVVNEGDIEISFSNGEKKIVAVAKKPISQERYFEIETYTKAVISPNRKFAALQGFEFEEKFVRVYTAQSDRLEDKIYGEVQDWDNLGRLGILSCNLAGEECTNYISISPDTPWVLEESI